MWARIKAIFRSLFGWMIRGAEKPELLLRQYIDDMRAQMPRLNAQVAEVIKHEKMLEMQVERKRETVAALQPRVEAAVKMGPEKKDLAKRLIASLQTTQAELAGLEESSRGRRGPQQMPPARSRLRTASRSRSRRPSASFARPAGRGGEADRLDHGRLEVGDRPIRSTA